MTRTIKSQMFPIKPLGLQDTGSIKTNPDMCPLCHLISHELTDLNIFSRNAKRENPHRDLDHQNSENKSSIIVGHSTNSCPNPTSCTEHGMRHGHEISQIVCEELRRFCENTTIRGLPRIVRAHNRSLRLLWSTLVCILVLGCFTCMFFLARQYLEYNVIHPPRVLRHTPSPFPAITLCNLRPISPDGMRYLRAKGWKTPRQFAQDFAYYARHLYFEKNRSAEYSAASSAFSLAAFLESLPNNNERRKLGYQNDKLVPKCQMTYLKGSNAKAGRCDTLGRWRKFIHPQYLNCATFEPFPELRASTTSIEMYVYLDELNDHAFCPDCFSTEVKSQLSGALIVIHAADCLPNVNDKSINLKPGSLTEIRLSTVENVQKMPPYGRCSPELPQSLQMYDTEYAYSEYACRESTKQRDIIQRCGCYSMEFPYNEHLGYESCGRLPRFVNLSTCSANELLSQSNKEDIEACTRETESFLQRIMCKRSITESSFDDAPSTCTMPCAFYSYEAAQSTSTWPTKTWQLTFLNSSYIRRLGLLQGPQFNVYRKAQQMAEQGNEAAAIQMLEGVSLLERNLLAVLINRPNFDVRKVEEKEVLSLTSLMSQTGGLFSIWMGLSMISLGEIFEFIMRCYVKARQARKHRCAPLQGTKRGPNCSDVYQSGITNTFISENMTEASNQNPTEETTNLNLLSLKLPSVPPTDQQFSSNSVMNTPTQNEPCLNLLHGNHLLWINFLLITKHAPACSQCGPVCHTQIQSPHENRKCRSHSLTEPL